MSDNERTSRKRPAGGPMGHAALGNVEKAKDFGGTIKKLINYIGRYKVALIIVLIFAIASTVFTVVGPKILGSATTDLYNGLVAQVEGTGSIDYTAISKTLLFLLSLYLISAACSFVQGWVMSSISQRVAFRMRKEISEKINRMPLKYFEGKPIGDVLSRITNDVDTLGQSLNQSVTQLITSVVSIIGVTVMMLTISWILTLVVFIILPVSAVIITLLFKFSQKYFKAQQEYLGAVDGQVEETFSGYEVVRAFNREQASLETFSVTNEKLYESAWKSQFISGAMQPIMKFVGNLGYVGVVVFGAMLAVRGTITVGDIQAFIQYVQNFTQPIMQLAQVSNNLQSMAAAAERVFTFLAEPEENSDEPSAHLPKEIPGHVDFDHVRFGYNPDEPIIKDFSSHVEPGQTIAIVGPTGAGKTTLVKLLMRFYDVDDGSISVEGTDIRTVSRADLRRCFAMVLQDTWVYKASIADNIRYGCLDATEEEVHAAADAAYVDHFIQTLPEGYATELNEEASNISQGQKQLLTIARAILADRPILILDEATSNVDTRTEERIQKAMDNLMANRTSFVIAHRLSTIRNADRILVIEQGDIVESGTHDELLGRGGAYAKLYNAQFEVGSD